MQSCRPEDGATGITRGARQIGHRAAKDAGLTCIGVGEPAKGEKLRAAGADHVIQNFVGFSFDDLKSLSISGQAFLV